MCVKYNLVVVMMMMMMIIIIFSSSSSSSSSFDWLAAFHLQLLQAILFIAV